MKKLLLSLGAIAITLTLLAGGIFAYQYLTFTGTEQAEQTNNNSSEMLEIIKDLSADKITAEEAAAQLLAQQEATAAELAAAQARVKELEDMNAPGLVKQIKELKNTNAQLTTDLNAKQNEINEKNTFIDQLQTERDGLQTQIDNLNAQLNEANNGKQSDKDEIARLEAELIKANETMAAVNAQSNADVEEARTYK